MGRTILTTCGTSLLTSGCWQLEGIGSLTGLSEDDRRVQEAINKNVILQKMQNDDTGANLANTFYQQAWGDTARLRDLPAEMASLRAYIEALTNQTPPVSLGNSDRIILLHSTNPEGQFCANVLRIVLTRLLQNVTIGMDPINRLDPIDFREFGTALTDIWVRYCDAVNNELNQNRRIIFNLTGGYKAMAMVLTALCAANSTIPITIIYLHETAPPNNLFVMDFQGHTICDRLRTEYFDINTRNINGVIVGI